MGRFQLFSICALLFIVLVRVTQKESSKAARSEAKCDQQRLFAGKEFTEV